MLTKGLDNIQGTSGNDTIIGSVDSVAANVELNTLSALDIINGGAGTDTLKIATNDATAVPLANISNVEIIEVQGANAGGTTVNTTTLTGITNLNVTKTAGAIAATAGATTDVSVALKAASAAVGVVGGKNISVDLTDVTGITNAVTIGAGTAPKGDVTVNMTGKAATATDLLSAVTTTGGKTVSVTQKATSDASAIATNKVAATITQGAVTVTGNADTTTVTVKQDASVNAVAAVDAVAAKAATQEVTFSAMTKGQILSLDFGAGALTFTANKDLTAAEAASAFANLAKDAKQGSAAASLGIYTDANADAGATTTTGVSDGWTSGAVQTVSATQSKVVFSNAAANPTAISNNALVTTATAPVAAGVNAGTAAVAAKTGVLGVTNGAVGVTDANGTIKTITVDGYANSTTTTTTVLETLNLSNSGLTYGAGKVTGAASMTVADTAATLALNLEKVGFSGYYNGDATTTTVAAVVTLTAAPTTLNVKSTGNNYVALADGDNAITTLNVSGTGLLDASTNDLAALKAIKVTETAGLKLNVGVANTVESVDTTGTTGTVTVSIEGNKATYAGGAGVDNVSVTNASTAISKAIDLGAGNDRLDLSATLAIDPTVEIKGGEGSDTIVLSAQAAHDRSAASTFEGKITSFEKLGIGSVAGAASYTVDMTNMDDINYVISANTTAALGAVDENALVTFQNLTAGQVVTVAGRTVTVAVGASATATDIAAAYLTGLSTATLAVGGLLAGWTPTASAAGVLKFTSTTAATNVADVSTLISDTALAAATAVAAGTATNGVAATSPESTAWTMSGLTNGQSYTIAGVQVIAQKTLTATEVAAAFAAGATSAGNYTVVNAYAAPAGWTAGTFSNIAGALTLTNGANGDVGDFTAVPASNVGGASPTDAVASAVVQGGAAVAAGALIIDKLVSNGTLELTAAGAGVEVKVTDATTSLTDVLNIVANAATGADLGSVKAAGVETINITANDTDATITTAGVANVSTNILKLTADKATTVKLEGAGNLTLTLDATSTAVTLIDGSTATGKLIVTTLASDLAATTVKGGSAADTLVAQGANDVLQGNAGKDTLKVTTGTAVTLTGGDGIDAFDVSTFVGTAGGAATITDLAKGETIKFVTDSDANFVSSKVTLVAGSTLTEYVAAAMKAASVDSTVDHGVAWFELSGNTYIVQNMLADATFNDNSDIMVMLTGTVDLSASSFNEVGQGTLLYI